MLWPATEATADNTTRRVFNSKLVKFPKQLQPPLMHLLGLELIRGTYADENRDSGGSVRVNRREVRRGRTFKEEPLAIDRRTQGRHKQNVLS